LKNRKLEIENPNIAKLYKEKIRGFNTKKELELFLINEPSEEYSPDLDFKLNKKNILK
jgi:site-specific DNA-methyltransferase (adenine-specific)